MDDGKCIRYKDLYALFEHILEKSMRLEQRDWNESPVKVWVNTFKVFLDEFMTEYKPMEGTIGRVRELKLDGWMEEWRGKYFKREKPLFSPLPRLPNVNAKSQGRRKRTL